MPKVCKDSFVKVEMQCLRGKSQKTLKDLNYIEMQKVNKKSILDISEKTKENLSAIISSDAEFLRQHNLMDYSLLI